MFWMFGPSIDFSWMFEKPLIFKIPRNKVQGKIRPQKFSMKMPEFLNE